MTTLELHEILGNYCINSEVVICSHKGPQETLKIKGVDFIHEINKIVIFTED